MRSIEWCQFQWPWMTLATPNHPIFNILSPSYWVEIETLNLVDSLIVASAGIRVRKRPWNGAWSGHVNRSFLVGTNHISAAADRLRCCWFRLDGQCGKLVTVSVTSLSHWPSTSVYNTVGMRHFVARVCQWQRRLVLLPHDALLLLARYMMS